MVFSSVTFLFYFLPIFVLLYFASPWKNTALLIGSLLFYSWGEFRNLPLLIISIIFNYACGRFIGAAQERGSSGKFSFCIGVTLNLIGLAYFKYFTFFQNSFSLLFPHAQPGATKPNALSLPLGISFFTFHAISYLIDVYRRKTPAERNFTALATYIMMFPQLIAGPIIRFSTIVKRIHIRRSTFNRTALGAKIFTVGLAQKVLIANTVALTADKVFSLDIKELSAANAWLGAICYTIQIYFDFFGYSNMAIGLGLIIGFMFPRNFNYPYSSKSVTEFWQRWHITLSRWFRDYLYIPLGGNRGSKTQTAFNLFLVFFLCGLWHGANWTFVVWGLYHGSFLVVERIGLNSALKRLPTPLRHCYAMIIVIVGWIFFRSDTVGQAIVFLHAMFGGSQFDFAVSPVAQFKNGALIAAMCAGILASTLFFERGFQKAKNYLHRKTNPGQAGEIVLGIAIETSDIVFRISILVASLLTLASGAYNPFIYFRF